MYWNHYYDNTRDKYSSLIKALEEKRKTLCGIGTRKIKMRLNKLSRRSVPALLYRKALEIEDKNISAKKYWNYRERNYEEKGDLIDDLVQLCNENQVKVGYQMEDEERELCIVYFHLPGCEQISWHTYGKPNNCPEYDEQWDGKENSTLEKLEAAIMTEFPEITH